MKPINHLIWIAVCMCVGIFCLWGGGVRQLKRSAPPPKIVEVQAGEYTTQLLQGLTEELEECKVDRKYQCLNCAPVYVPEPCPLTEKEWEDFVEPYYEEPLDPQLVEEFERLERAVREIQQEFQTHEGE